MRMIRIPILFAALFVALAAHAGAVDSRMTCVDLVTNFHDNLDINPLVQAQSMGTLPKHELPTESTVNFEGEVAGRHGGKGLLLRKTGAKWVSTHRTTSYDPQGDPRTFVDVLGEKAAAFFGFKILSDDLVQVPDHAEFAGAAKKVNEWLVKNNHEPLAITFYEGSSGTKVIVKDYLEKFAGQLGIPIAPNGNHLLHDISFHTGAFFIPRDLLVMRAETIKYMEGFIAFAEKRFANDEPKLKAVKYFAYIWRMHQTEKIDLATATPNLGILEMLRRPGSDHYNALENVVDLLTNYGDNPEEFLNNSVDAVYSDVPFQKVGEVEGEYYFAKLDTVKRHRANMPKSLLEQAYLDFAYDHPIPARLDKMFQQSKTQETKERHCKEMTLRRQIIREAALAF